MDENFDVQDTTPEYSQEKETDFNSTEDTVVTPNVEETVEENITRDTKGLPTQESVSEKGKVTEPFVSVQYNHKNRDFTKEEAIKFIQKGMHTESLRAKLEYLAKAQGTDVNSLVEKIITAPEKAYRAHLEQTYGKDSPDVEIGMAIYREKQSDEYKRLMSESENSIENEEKNKSVNSRLADEYMNLKAEMPEAPEYSDLPDSVIIEAAEGKRDLYSAYLRYLHKEKVKIDAAKNTQQAATTASSGKMGQNSRDSMNSTDRSFLSGLWEK